jgi:hypothetical protein
MDAVPYGQHGPMHGWAISKHIRQISEDVLEVNQGSLYPALYRLEKRDWIEAVWGILGLVVKQGMRPALIGIGVGLLMALGMTRVLQSRRCGRSDRRSESTRAALIRKYQPRVDTPPPPPIS